MSSMDFITGFVFGYVCKEVVAYLKRLSGYDWDNRNYYDGAYDWDTGLNEDDLP